MTESGEPDIVIRSKRGKLIAQVAAVAGVGVGAGIALQSTRLLASSALGRLGEGTGLPIVVLAVAGIAIAIGVVMVRDSWNRTITLQETGMMVLDNLGSYTLPYANIEHVKAVPLGGVVVSIRDPQAWLASVTGDPSVRRKTAEVINAQYGGHVWFYDKHLSVGAEEFIEMLESKMRASVERAG